MESCDSNATDDPEYKSFNARQYLYQRYPGNIFEIGEKANYGPPWLMPCYHKFYEQFHKEWDSCTARLLDLGGGPCIHLHISAAPYVSEIYHSDYVQSCRDEVLLWKNKDPDAYDWSSYFKHVVHTLEGQSDPDAVGKRTEMVQDKMKGVLFCDARNPNLLPGYNGEKFDIIASSACIENLVKSVEEYENILKRIKHLLNHKGFFVIMANLKCTFYYINGKKYPSFPITEQNIISSLEKTGYIVRHKDLCLKSQECFEAYTSSNTIGRMFCVAQNI